MALASALRTLVVSAVIVTGRGQYQITANRTYDLLETPCKYQTNHFVQLGARGTAANLASCAELCDDNPECNSFDSDGASCTLYSCCIAITEAVAGGCASGGDCGFCVDTGCTSGCTTSTTTTTNTTTSTTLTSTTNTTTSSTTSTTTPSTTTTTTSTEYPYVAAGGDPVTVYGGTRHEFRLPVGTLLPMLVMSDMHLFGATFAGEDDEQWFDYFEVRSADGHHVVQVRIKRDIAQFNRTASPRNAFETLDVAVGDAAAPLRLMPPWEAMILQRGIQVGFRRMNQSHMYDRVTTSLRIGRAQRECMEIACLSAHLAVCSAPAGEYNTDHQWHLAVKYAHLNLAVFGFRAGLVEGGVLPEIWGLKPMSDETRGFMQTPRARELFPSGHTRLGPP